ncbi:MAG TPA: tRNA-dihydrouridine synthase family protein [Candidatus Nanoarchaeia archaeon]|nr:tRNA-dihydrouridine synthase family protein [Candidatus Nanoarchaeia archaeon]
MTKLPSFPSKAFLAPMAGVSDAALRLLCRELGAGLVVTEFISIHAVNAKSQDITKFIEFSEKERPLSCQLFGSDLEKIKQAIKIVEPYFDIIDFNMGCPAPHITNQMACSALLQEPELTRKIFRTMVQATKKPISVKIRAGITKPDRWKEIALIAEEEGLSMITFHPRTVKQGYAGKSDWNLIKEMKQLVKIPVCGNGDIETPEDAKRMLDETGCDYVMIGRGAAKNPYLFKQINAYLKYGNYPKILPKTKLKYFFTYLDYAKNYSIKPAQIRMQAMNFSRGCDGGKKLRGDLLGKNTVEEIRAVLENFYCHLE